MAQKNWMSVDFGTTKSYAALLAGKQIEMVRNGRNYSYSVDSTVSSQDGRFVVKGVKQLLGVKYNSEEMKEYERE